MMSSTPTSECEFDPDHLYHDHREADGLRAEIKRLWALYEDVRAAHDAHMNGQPCAICC